MKKLGLLLFGLILLGSTALSQFLFQEDFSYSAGDQLVNNGWTRSGTTVTNPILVVTPGLTATGYGPSGIGNAIGLINTGEDLYKAMTSTVTSGSGYVWAMINVSAAQTGDYFLAFSPSTGQTNYSGRMYVKATTGGYLLGLNKSNEVSTGATYGTTVLSLNTTYVVVMKYTFVAGDSNDVVSAYVFPSGSIPPDEPGTPEVGPWTANTKPDASDLGFITVRQGTAAQAATLILDGLRVTTAWEIPLPVQLASFAAVRASDDVQLSWSTISELNNFGFYVERKLDGTSSFTEVPNSFVAGHATTLEAHNYTFTDNTVTSGVWYYRLRQVDLDGKVNYSEPVKVEFTTAVTTETPATYGLNQNYPNPFNPTTDIQFSLAKAGTVSLKVYDMLGREVATLANGEFVAGVHHVTFNATTLPSGAYFYALKAGNFSAMKSMMLVK